MSQRAALYARYSSDLQRDASIEDQIRLCSERAQSEGWQVVNCYTDAGMSGASLLRPGIQALMQAGLRGEFDILLAEAMDRLSRDQEDIAGLFKRMEFAGVKIITLSEGEVTSLHIGLKGTMNAMFLKDLADKTRRGLRGKVEQGQSGGGIAYGYKVIKQFTPSGEALRGEREIDPEQADIVRRIFNEYAHQNKSPKAIAAQLNKDAIPCPSGKAWGQSTINGNRKRGTGILNNDLYRGVLVWNRQRFIKDPATGKRVPRFNPESEWITKEVPELRIVDDALWSAAKARQAELDRTKPDGLWKTNRPQYLLSGLTKCGQCGGGYAKINSTQYGCANAKNKGMAVCSNRKSISREKLENSVLDALQTRLMDQGLVDVFCSEYTKHLALLTKEHNAAQRRYEDERKKLALQKDNLIQALKDGVPAAMVKDDLERLAARQEELEALSKAAPSVKPLIHPAIGQRYRAAVSQLRTALNKDGSRAEAADHLRKLIEKVVITPMGTEEELQIDLYGDLAGILNMSKEDKSAMKSFELLDRLCLSPVNDNSMPIHTDIDRIGSGGWI